MQKHCLGVFVFEQKHCLLESLHLPSHAYPPHSGVTFCIHHNVQSRHLQTCNYTGMRLANAVCRDLTNYVSHATIQNTIAALQDITVVNSTCSHTLQGSQSTTLHLSCYIASAHCKRRCDCDTMKAVCADDNEGALRFLQQQRVQDSTLVSSVYLDDSDFQTYKSR